MQTNEKRTYRHICDTWNRDKENWEHKIFARVYKNEQYTTTHFIFNCNSGQMLQRSLPEVHVSDATVHHNKYCSTNKWRWWPISKTCFPQISHKPNSNTNKLEMSRFINKSTSADHSKNQRFFYNNWTNKCKKNTCLFVNCPVKNGNENNISLNKRFLTPKMSINLLDDFWHYLWEFPQNNTRPNPQYTGYIHKT